MPDDKMIKFLAGVKLLGSEGTDVALIRHGSDEGLPWGPAIIVAACHTAAAIVRCADCKFWLRVSGNEGDCTAHRVAIVSREDCYCSWGERKDG